MGNSNVKKSKISVEKEPKIVNFNKKKSQNE